MRDPVRLPGTQVVDRINIKRHLLNDQRDPFTRSPLKEVELVSDKELKDEIDRWKKNRLE
jgi:ubiquitin conjugation factor E4 B